ncbi:MAG TPA: 3-oxoacyl-ACP reductase FabG [Candidatus Limnocylindrales bacterium]|nr:3-oxoacyl-ACP reductase FabG [Candidatus Limnocylindrales bacterium]
MPGALADRVVLVTGSSRGIGAEVAVKAAAAGATVAVHCRTGRDGAARTLERVRAAGADGEVFEADLADGDAAEELVRDVIDRLGRIDGLVNNAGRTQVGDFTSLEPGEWDAVIATDLTAAYRTCRAAVPSMVARGSGTIVNVASRLGQTGVGRTAAYSAAKAGLIGLTRSLARELAPTGVRVNAVAPGFTLTGMTADIADTETGRQRLADMPIGRFGRADEVADAVVFLLTDASALFTGQTLNPNGGGYMP